MPRKPKTPPPADPSLPDTLIPPGEAADSQKSAYWIELLGDVEQLKKATETTDFFELMHEFPPAVWDRLTIYLYRLPDDGGMLIKNSDDKPHYIKVLRQPLTEEFVSKNWGGGKYQAYLKIDNKEVLRKHTFRIDGEPKLQPGQRVEIEGKSVPVGTVAPTPTSERSDVAAVIEASSNASDKSMEILAKASSTAIEMVRDQANAAAKPTENSGIVDKLLTIMLTRLAEPPPTAPDPIESFIKLQSLISKQNPEAEPERETPLDETLGVIQKLTGKDSIADLLKPSNRAVEENPWAPFAPVLQQFVSIVPNLVAEFRATRQIEFRIRDIEFRRAAWMRDAKPGTPTPPELLNSPELPAPRQHSQPNANQPASQPAVNLRDPNQLVPLIVQTIAERFDRAPRQGYRCAAAIDALYGEHIEALGLDKFLSNPAQIAEFVAQAPLLAERAKDARWPAFQEDFMGYTVDLWGEPPADEDESDDGKAEPKPVAQMPRPPQPSTA